MARRRAGISRDAARALGRGPSMDDRPRNPLERPRDPEPRTERRAGVWSKALPRAVLNLSRAAAVLGTPRPAGAGVRRSADVPGSAGWCADPAARWPGLA